MYIFPYFVSKMASLREGTEFIGFIIESGQSTDDGLSMLCIHPRHHKISADLFCFIALRTKSTAMVIAGRSVHLTTLFPGQA